MHELIDLRSDTVTKPTAEMLAAMMAAKVGDDVYGEDPTVNTLEEKVAKILGKESALFVPTGTMANQIAINLHCRPGDSIITEQDSHCFLYEAGGAAALSGVQFDLIPADEGLSAAAVQKRFRGGDIHSASSSLLVIENTHNRGGGWAKTSAMISPVVEKAKSLGLFAHCDGARLWNAAVATGESEATLAKSFDSLAVCFSKGLGAPVGSALVGTKPFIERARKVRKRWGGGMRQAGFLAAAALYALDHHRERLADDHRRVDDLKSMLKAGIKNSADLEIQETKHPTNMIYFRTPKIDGDQFAAKLKDQGILLFHMGDNLYRAVFHLHITENHLNRLAATIVGVINSHS